MQPDFPVGQNEIVVITYCIYFVIESGNKHHIPTLHDNHVYMLSLFSFHTFNEPDSATNET